jgi:thioredoxin
VVTTITAADYDRVVQQQGKLVVVDFYADWCGPCRMLAPMLEKVAAESGDKAVVVKLNVDNAKDIAQREKVHGIPDVRFFLDGKQVDKIVGLPPESDLRARFERHTQNIKIPSTEPKPQDAAAGSPAQPKKKEDAIKPMSKDWMPPGLHRK